MLALRDKGAGKGKKTCFHFRDHGSWLNGKECPYSYDKELRKPCQTEAAPVGARPTRPLLARDPRAAVKPRPAKAKAKAGPKGGERHGQQAQGVPFLRQEWVL